MNTGSLNIYKVSGKSAGNSVKSAGNSISYWSAGTSTIMNTTSFNYMLSEVNMLMAELSITEDSAQRIQLMNEIDIDLIIMEGLRLCGECQPAAVGSAINTILKSGIVWSDSTDDAERSKHYEKIRSRLKTLSAKQEQPSEDDSSEFLTFWYGYLMPMNQNNVPDVVKERYQEVFEKRNGAVGASVDPKDYRNLEDYIEDACSGFLYLFLDEPRKYNTTIRLKYDQEVDNFKYLQRVTQKTDGELMNLLRAGIIKKYGMTPEEKILQLENLGSDYLMDKVGDAAAALAMTKLVLEVISMIIALLAALWAIIKEIFQATYNAPIDYDKGAPETSDFNIPDYNKRNQDTGSFFSKYGLGIAVGAAILLMMNKKQ